MIVTLFLLHQMTLTKAQVHSLVAETYTKYSIPYNKKDAEALVKIIKKESSFNTRETNSKSTSRGLTGFLRSTEKAYGITWDSPLTEQIKAMITYCKRYGSPGKAWDFHKRKGWY